MKVRYFFIFAIVLLLAGIGSFAWHASQADAQTQAILASDKTSQDTAIARAELESFVHAHMGTSVAFTLDVSYQRAVKAAQDAAAGGSAQGQVYAQAQSACAGRSDSISQARCVTSYVASHSTPGAQPVAVVMPEAAKYQYRYLAPLWTPDLTGVCLLGSLLAGLGGLGLLVTRRRHPKGMY